MTLLAGRYELAEELGLGGMARVVAAHDLRLGRRVAVKLVREELTNDPGSRERLLREARAAAGLQHPNTVAVHDVGEEEGQAFVVMELVEGRTLADRLREEGPLSPEEVVEVGAAVLSALDAAHARGLVHRDVKPGNVLLPYAGGVKLADFGIAKALDGASADLTATGQVLGTPRYLAPEQAAGRGATTASDLYSLGAVLYECLTGRPPFEAETPVALALAHQREPVPDLRLQEPSVPPALARIVEQALAKDAAERPADAAAMRADLRAAHLETAGGPPDSTPPVGDRSPGPFGGVEATRRLTVGDPLPLVRRWRWVVVAVVVLAGVAAVAMLLDRGATTPAQDPPAATGADGDDTGRPADLGDLAAELARDPEAAGERGPDLLEGLLELRGESGEDRREDARQLVRDIAEWLHEDEVEREVAGDAVRLLEVEGRPADGGLAPVSELFGRMALELDAWGDKADSLHGDLEDLLDEDPEDRLEEVDKLVDELERRLEKGELDATRGREAMEVLGSVSDGMS